MLGGILRVNMFYQPFSSTRFHKDIDEPMTKVLDVTPHRSRLIHYILGDTIHVNYHGLCDSVFMEEKLYKNGFKFPLVCFNTLGGKDVWNKELYIMCI